MVSEIGLFSVLFRRYFLVIVVTEVGFAGLIFLPRISLLFHGSQLKSTWTSIRKIDIKFRAISQESCNIERRIVYGLVTIFAMVCRFDQLSFI